MGDGVLLVDVVYDYVGLPDGDGADDWNDVGDVDDLNDVYCLDDDELCIVKRFPTIYEE